ncbi:hypothetical protein PENPOL_c044G06897 [Penicillium polonicum]|uniref:Retrovirus-related Pol polyprotein from transposon TNT 1-94-like beta-barrel domain-containing protein n=1 Tax=Penicillium polonicum TaxID=60169 RepID=A0A1V6N5H3_PENPO|nr:hypothetical protein PENPOL_c044G06897 [Penicillium polonicum]
MADFDDGNEAGEGSTRSLPASRQQQQSAQVRKTRTQATNLPEEKEIKLNKGVKLLLDGSNLARWKRQIENGLGMVRIDKYWSKIACGWIESLLDQEIITILEGGVEAFPRRADDMMREVETLVRGAEITDNVRREVIKFHKMRRSDFSSADAYITAYQTQYNQLGLHKVEPHAFGAMFVMLYDLEEELDSVKFTYQAMKDTIPDSVTKDVFNSLCKKLIVEARDAPASSSSTTTTSANAARKKDVVFEGWKPHDNVWSYVPAKWSSYKDNKDDKGKGKAGVARANAARSIDNMWMLDSGASKTITGYCEDFYEYSKYKPREESYSYTNANGDVQFAIAYGKAPIQIKTLTGKVRTILVTAYHDTTTKDRLLSINALEADHGIFHDPIMSILVRENCDEVGLVKKVSGLLWIDGLLY